MPAGDYFSTTVVHSCTVNHEFVYESINTTDVYFSVVKCDPTPPTVINATYVQAGFYFNDTVVYSCTVGHEFVDGLQVKVSHCQDDFSWETPWLFPFCKSQYYLAVLCLSIEKFTLLTISSNCFMKLKSMVFKQRQIWHTRNVKSFCCWCSQFLQSTLARVTEKCEYT